MRDKHSFGNIDQVLVNHLDLNLNVDFDQKELKGFVDLSLKVLVDDLDYVILDSRNLNISKCLLVKRNDQKEEKEVEFKHDVVDRKVPAAFGRPLRLYLSGKDSASGLKRDDQIVVRVYYNTTEQSEAIQWLKPEQTAGKEHPYLFTQCQAIHARSLVPCVDSPVCKATYTAAITCVKPLVAVMSATLESSLSDNESKSTFKFNQKIPIPSYLIALAVGELESKSIGKRSKVWSEKNVLEDAAWEFSQTEDFIQAAESFLPPYQWGIYDVLLLPPSFPYGGMENPSLTFATPTLIAKDKSLTFVIAHEIAHSWSGNLVTNRGWEDFWLNEGFTVYIERRIIARIYSQKEAEFHAMLGYTDLEESVEFYEKNNQMEYTKLLPKLDNIDPDDSFSSVPYEKGFNFLYYLTTVVGGFEAFEGFLYKYFEKFALKTVGTEDMKKFFLEYFNGKVEESKLNSIEWDKWFYSEGLPHIKNKFDTTLADEAVNLSKKWIESGGKDANEDDIKGWSSNQVVYFLTELTTFSSKNPNVINEDILDRLEKTYKLNETLNCEIKFSWQMLCVKQKYEKIFDRVVKFITEQGRMKYVRPLYRTLFESNETGKQLAVETFKKNRSIYHSIASKMIAKDLKLE